MLNKYDEIMSYVKEFQYILLKCNKCSFIWQENQPTRDLQDKLYNEWISFDLSLNKSKKINNQIFYKEILNIIDKPKKEMNILDFGAGAGSFSKFSKLNEFNIFALESSSERINYLKQHNIKIVNYNNYENYYNFFDFIYVNQVIEHLTDLKEFFKLINYVSKKECKIYISVPTAKTTNIKISKGPYQPLEHVNSFNNTNLTLLFKNNDFKKINFLYFVRLFLKKKISFFFFFKRIIHQYFTTSIFFSK